MSKRQSDERKVLAIFQQHDPAWQAMMLEVLRHEVDRTKPATAASPVSKSPVKRRRGPNKPKSTTAQLATPVKWDTATGKVE